MINEFKGKRVHRNFGWKKNAFFFFVFLNTSLYHVLDPLLLLVSYWRNVCFGLTFFFPLLVVVWQEMYNSWDEESTLSFVVSTLSIFWSKLSWWRSDVSPLYQFWLVGLSLNCFRDMFWVLFSSIFFFSLRFLCRKMWSWTFLDFIF